MCRCDRPQRQEGLGTGLTARTAAVPQVADTLTDLDGFIATSSAILNEALALCGASGVKGTPSVAAASASRRSSLASGLGTPTLRPAARPSTRQSPQGSRRVSSASAAPSQVAPSRRASVVSLGGEDKAALPLVAESSLGALPAAATPRGDAPGSKREVLLGALTCSGEIRGRAEAVSRDVAGLQASAAMLERAACPLPAAAQGRLEAAARQWKALQRKGQTT